MACALTQGYTLDCRDSAGGIDVVYLAEFDGVSGTTQSAGIVSAIGKNTGKRFWKYNLQRATGNWEEVYTDSAENGTSFHVQTLNMILNKMMASVSQEIKLLAQNRLMAVVKDKNGKYWLLGEEHGLQRNGGRAGSGTAMGDRNGYELVFTSDNKAPAPEVAAGVISTLETPG
jgi:hypothetical protein